MSAASVRTTLRDAVERRDHPAIVELLAEDVILRSPVIPFPFEGRSAVSDVYATVLEKFESFEFVAELGEEEGPQMLRFKSRVEGRDGEVVTLLTTSGDRVTEVVIFARPLVTVTAIGVAMGTGLARRRGRLQWLVASLLTRPLPHLIASANPLLPRLIRLR